MKNLERYLWLAVMTASTAVLLSATSAAPELASSGAFFWWRWILLFAVSAGLVLFLAGWLSERWIGHDLHPVLRWLVTSWLLAVALYVNRQAAFALLGLGDASRQGLAGGLAFVLVLLATLAVAAWGKGQGWGYRCVSVLALAAFALWLWPRAVGSGGTVDLPAARPTGQRLLVIGLDGADWRYIEPLMERGELPNLQKLVESGIRGPLATFRPSRSPALWTTVVTGKSPRDHGIEDHAVMRPKNDRHSLPKPRVMAQGFFIKPLFDLLYERGQIVNSPATSVERRVPAFWNISTAYESPLDVVNWWATWPAEAILGRMVTDRTYFWRWAARGYGDVDEALTFPDALYRQLAPLVMRPDEVTIADARRFMAIDDEEFAQARESAYRHHEILSEFKYYYSMFETHRRIVSYFFDRAESEGVAPSDLMVIYRLLDMLSHSSLRYSELVEDHLGSSDEDVARFRGAVSEAYRQVDFVVGDMAAAFGEGNILVISDHGFKREGGKKKGKAYDHKSGPSGVFLASGPAFGNGEIEGLSLYHVLPLLLALKGFPVPGDIVEDVPKTVFASGFLDQHPIVRIESYGAIDLSRTGLESAVDEEMMERLEALGYLD